jgi:hypothetical protein
MANAAINGVTGCGVRLHGLVERSRFAAEKNYRHWEFPFKYSTIEKVAKNLKTT